MRLFLTGHSLEDLEERIVDPRVDARELLHDREGAEWRVGG